MLETHVPDACHGSSVRGVRAKSVQAIKFEPQSVHTEHARRFVHNMHRYSIICHETPYNDGAASTRYFSWTFCGRSGSVSAWQPSPNPDIELGAANPPAAL